MESPVTFLSPWASFYAMIGSSTAALIGLMFVVITLVTGTERRRRSPEGTATYSTPTLVHFASVLLVAAVLSAPWTSLLYPRVVLGLAAAYGIFYVVHIALRIKRMDGYDADLEDWSWHTALPILAYVAILVGALFLDTRIAGQVMFAFAAAAITMLFVGIHNAWDIVTFVALGNLDDLPDSSEKTD